jgi:hypothetical protein
MTIANIPISGLYMEIKTKNIPPNINKICHGEIMKKKLPTIIPKRTQERNSKIIEGLNEKLDLANTIFFNSIIN